MPKLNGLEALERIKQYDNTAKVVMLTIHEDREYLIKALDPSSGLYFKGC